MATSDPLRRPRRGERDDAAPSLWVPPVPDEVITVSRLTKRYGPDVAVADVSFAVRRGTIVGLLGPNGSGKTTTLRLLLGLAEPDSGTAFFGGYRFQDLPDQDRVGVLLEDPRGQVPLSHGARRRSALTRAMVTEPGILVLDEPATGLDPAGIGWLHRTLRAFVQAGNTVLVSGRVLAEVEPAVDEVVVLNQGRVLTQASIAELRAGVARTASMRVRTPHAGKLAAALVAHGHAPVHLASDVVRVHDIAADELGWLVAGAEVVVYEMVAEPADLEAALGLT